MTTTRVPLLAGTISRAVPAGSLGFAWVEGAVLRPPGLGRRKFTCGCCAVVGGVAGRSGAGRGGVSLIDDILTVARMEHGPLQRVTDIVDLPPVVSEVVESVRATALRKGLNLIWSTNTEHIQVIGDSSQLQRAIGNIVGNAVKFTPADGSVVVSLEASEQDVRIAVADTGIGIPLEDQDHIFAAFTRATNARNEQIPGSGLGLHITQQIVGEHDGEIVIESAPGEGTKVVIVIPSVAAKLRSLDINS